MIAQLPTEHTRPFDYLASMALQMWEACRNSRSQRIEYLKAVSDANAYAEAQAKLIVQPETFPASIEVFLRLMMPKKRTVAERTEIFKQYISFTIRDHLWTSDYRPKNKSFDDVPVPTHDAIEATLNSYRNTGIPESIYNNFAFGFRRWFSSWEASIRQERASKGGQILKQKREAQKAVEHLEKSEE
jgi:hypothetical protein